MFDDTFFPVDLMRTHFFFSDPPLEEQDIPKGEWLCHACKYTKKLPSIPALRNKRSNSTPVSSVNASSSCSNGKMAAKKAKIMNPMEMLIEAANAMNPKQFELPRSMSVPCVFPGTDKGKRFQCTGCISHLIYKRNVWSIWCNVLLNL